MCYKIRRALLNRYKLPEFQKAVLLEVSKLKLGETATYAEIASRIHRKNAWRAVGNALNKNPLPIIIPCHRVIASNGIGNYKYGKRAKRFLLAVEHAARVLLHL